MIFLAGFIKEDKTAVSGGKWGSRSCSCIISFLFLWFFFISSFGLILSNFVEWKFWSSVVHWER